MKSFLIRFVVLFAAVFGAIFMLVWFYLSVTAPAGAAGLRESAETERFADTISFERADARIVGRDGKEHIFVVELAQSAEQHRQGLMYRKHLEPGHGMLFDYDPPRTIAMWMKNTYISLDMLFFDENGRIVRIAARTEPLSLKLIPAPTAVRYVLEVPAGTAEALGIKFGDRLVMP